MIRKLMILAATGVCAAAMASGVWADDIVVNTSVGSGEVVFAQTDETADITEEELTELVKEAARQAGDLTMIDAFLDAEADVSIKLGAENEMAIRRALLAWLTDMKTKGMDLSTTPWKGLEHRRVPSLRPITGRTVIPITLRFLTAAPGRQPLRMLCRKFSAR